MTYNISDIKQPAPGMKLKNTDPDPDMNLESKFMVRIKKDPNFQHKCISSFLKIV